MNSIKVHEPRKALESLDTMPFSSNCAIPTSTGAFEYCKASEVDGSRHSGLLNFIVPRVHQRQFIIFFSKSEATLVTFLFCRLN